MGLVLSKTGADAQAQPQAPPSKWHTFLDRAGRAADVGMQALNIYCMGSDFADGRSIGGIAGDQAGFMLGNKIADGLLSKFKFPGKSMVSGLGGMGISMFLSPAIGDFMDKHVPIYRRKVEPTPSAKANNQFYQMQMPPQMMG